MARTPKGRASTNVQKPYSDDKNKGRRTGKTVKEGHRDEDGWEDFEELWRINVASPRPINRTPQTPRRSYTRDHDPDDSFDTTTVQEEDSGPSPSAYAASIPRPAPSSVPHLGSLSWRIGTSRPIDFDTIPSPSKTSRLGRSRHSQNSLTAKNARKSNLTPSSSKAREPPQEYSEPESEEMEAPVRARSSQTNATRKSNTASKQLTARATASDSEDAAVPDHGKNDRAPVSSSDDSGPDDDLGGPYDHDGMAPMDTDFGFDLGQQDDAYDAPVDVDIQPFGDQTNRQSGEEQQKEEPRAEPKAAKTKNKKRKSKDANTSRRADRTQLSPVAEQDEDMEHDIAAGLQALDDQQSDEAPEPDSKPRPKKARTTKTVKRGQNKQRGPSIPPEGHVTMGELGGGEESHGVRRSTRHRHKPLEYWRGERIILGRSEDGPALCPVLKGFLEIPKEAPDALGVKRKRSRTTRSTSRGPRATSSQRNTENPENVVVESKNPEDGWDDDTPVDGDVVDFVTQQELHRRLAFTAKHVEPEPAIGGEFAFKKLFGDDDFIASGVITFPVGGKKPMKGTKDNTYVFFVHAGAVEVTVHRQVLTLATGGTFIVPRGNQYEIRNIAQRETVLFFAQARKVPIEDDENVDGTQTATSVGPSVSLRRSVSGTPRQSAGLPHSPAATLQQFTRQQQRSASKPTPITHRMASISPTKSQLSLASPIKSGKSKFHSSAGRERHR